VFADVVTMAHDAISSAASFGCATVHSPREREDLDGLQAVQERLLRLLGVLRVLPLDPPVGNDRRAVVGRATQGASHAWSWRASRRGH
jgi:hypothetical protein